MRDWPLTKIIDVSEHFHKKTFEPGQIIYDLCDKVDNIYFVQSGQVEQELFYMITHSRAFPASKREKSRTHINQIVSRRMRRIGHGRQFGFEEVVKC